ncbi:MAG: hypothetical protein L0956_10400 [Candidatus Mariimomonas ferrooxydans]
MKLQNSAHLQKEGIIMSDGGTIFELEQRGYVSAGPFTLEAVIEHPEEVEHEMA